MKRKRNILLLAVVLMTAVVASLPYPREPKYRGKSLTEWLLDADTHPDFRAGVVIPSLMALLSDPDEQVRRITAAALSLYGPKAAQAIPALERLFLDPSVQVRRGATNALKEIVAKRSSQLKPDGTSGMINET